MYNDNFKHQEAGFLKGVPSCQTSSIVKMNCLCCDNLIHDIKCSNTVDLVII